jgi:uncharacterized protein (TIGR03067 family)
MHRLLAVAVVALSLPLAAAPVPKGLKRSAPPDRERILGAWQIVPEKGQAKDAITWTFTDGQMHSSSGNTRWRITLDPDQSPKQINITDYPGIYEFDGDTLKIAYRLSAPRPTEFTTANGVTVTTLVRAKEQPGK